MKKRHILLLVLAASLFLCSCGEIKIESITLSKNALELKEGESAALTAIVAPENATESYSWKSGDESIVTVDGNGTVTAVAPGSTNILAASESGKTAVCSVTVAAPTAEELLNNAEKKLYDYMVGSMLESFYNASAVRIRKIYSYFPVDEGENDFSLIIIDLHGTNRLGGVVYKTYWVSGDEGDMTYLDTDDAADYGIKPVFDNPMPTTVMDPAKINAALEEYWNNVGMPG